MPFTVNPDGSDLTIQKFFIGGHPEWLDGHQILGHNENDLIDCIATIKKSDNILFEKYIFAVSVKNNIKWIDLPHDNTTELQYLLDELGNTALYFVSDLSKAVSGEIHYVDCGFNIVGMPQY